MTVKYAMLSAVLACSPAYASSEPTTNYIQRNVQYGQGAQPNYADLCLVSMGGGHPGQMFNEVFVGVPYVFLTAQKGPSIVGALQAQSLIAAAKQDIAQGKACGNASGVRIDYVWVGNNAMDAHLLRTMCGAGLRDGATSAAGSLVSAMVDGWCGALPVTHN